MFYINEILNATGGKLIQKGGRDSVSGVSTDTRTIKPGDLFVALKGRNFDGHKFIEEAVKKGACAVIVGAGLVPSAPTLIRVKDTLRALGDIAHYYRMKFDIPVIGVTGSNGKTTTKEMIYKVLASKFKVLKNEGTENNLIGVPKTLLGLKPLHDMAVLELGTNHFGEIKRLSCISNPTMGVITNIGSSHLEFLESEKGVFREKSDLLKGLGKNSAAILNADDELLQKAGRLKCKIVRFGIDNICDFRATDIICHNDETDFMVNGEYPFKIRLLGRHNVYNALAAISAGFLNKIEHREIYNALYRFNPVKGRMFLRVVEGIHIIDDTYNSNPHSLKMAITALSNYRSTGRKILICGDMLELGKSAHEFHYQAGRFASEAGVSYLISVGNFREIVNKGAFSGGMKRKAIFSCKNNQAALAALKQIIKENDAVLLKGSRLIKLDEVVDALLSSIPAQRRMVRL